jgi:H+/Cl- antiporter ClcA
LHDRERLRQAYRTMNTSKISTLGAVHIGVAWSLYVVAILSVMLRFLCRRRLRQKIFVDDWLTLAAVFFALVMVIEVHLWSQGGGFGYQIVSLSKPQRKEFFHVS